MNFNCLPVPLAAKVSGDSGEALVFLHGLLGSSRNWRAIGAMLDDRYRVSLIDLRNHGDSPRTGEFGYDEMACDVGAWIETNLNGEAATVVGHSLGGKAAMRLACVAPNLVKRLVIVDISSQPAPRIWGPVFDAMLSLDLATLKDRKDADAHFDAHGISDSAMRKFLASNLSGMAGSWRWKVGVDALNRSSHNFIGAVLAEGDRYDGPAVLIRGGSSNYAPESDFPVMRAHFPKLEIVTVPNVGHNVHIEAPQTFVETLESFIGKNS
jgi:esterase